MRLIMIGFERQHGAIGLDRLVGTPKRTERVSPVEMGRGVLRLYGQQRVEYPKCRGRVPAPGDNDAEIMLRRYVARLPRQHRTIRGFGLVQTTVAVKIRGGAQQVGGIGHRILPAPVSRAVS